MPARVPPHEYRASPGHIEHSTGRLLLGDIEHARLKVPPTGSVQNASGVVGPSFSVGDHHRIGVANQVPPTLSVSAVIWRSDATDSKPFMASLQSGCRRHQNRQQPGHPVFTNTSCARAVGIHARDVAADHSRMRFAIATDSDVLRPLFFAKRIMFGLAGFVLTA